MKAFADDKLKDVKMMSFLVNVVGNILEQGGSAVYQDFPPFPEIFSKIFF